MLAHLGLGGDHHDVLDAHLGRPRGVGLGQAHHEQQGGDQARCEVRAGRGGPGGVGLVGRRRGRLEGVLERRARRHRAQQRDTLLALRLRLRLRQRQRGEREREHPHRAPRR